MSATTYTLNGAVPTPIYPGGIQTDSIVKNVASDTVWIGQDSNVSAFNGFPLGAGSSLIWDANKPLYAQGSSAASRLLVTFGVGNLFDAQAIAAQISISGAPPVDDQNVIAGATFVSSGVRQTLDVPNVTAYQSVTVYTREENATPPAFPTARRIQVAWGVDNGASFTVYDAEAFYLTDNNNTVSSDVGYATYQTSVKNRDMHIDVEPNGVNGKSVIVIVTGSYKNVPRPRYVNRSAYWNGAGTLTVFGTATDGMATMQQTAAVLGTAYELCTPSKSGPCTLTYAMQGAAGGTGFVVVRDVPNLGNVEYFNTGATVLPAAGNTAGQVTLNLPQRPVSIFFINSVAPNVAIFRCTLAFDPT